MPIVLILILLEVGYWSKKFDDGTGALTTVLILILLEVGYWLY